MNFISENWNPNNILLIFSINNMNSILKNWIFVNLPIWAEYFWLICFGVMTFTAD